VVTLYIYNLLLHSLLQLLVSWAWLTIVLKWYDSVGWVIWPIKLSMKWPVMYQVGLLI